MHANNGSRQNIEQLEKQEICSLVTDFENVWFPSQINSKVFHSAYIKIPGKHHDISACLFLTNLFERGFLSISRFLR
jgi:hypothetical protein